MVVTVALAVLQPAAAGSVEDPDMSDGTGDSVSGNEARDLVSGWVGDETANGISLGLKVEALDPYTPYPDISQLPVVNYEFFFDVIVEGNTSHYMARAVVPIHGPAAATASYNLYQVTYNSQGQVTDTVSTNAIVGQYNYQASEINFVVDKPFIGDPGRDDVLSGIWARITSASQRNAEDPVTEDTMASHLSPGRSYIFSGGVVFYLITLSSTDLEGNATYDAPVSFEVDIENDVTSDEAAEVEIVATTELPRNWSMETDYQKYSVEPGETVTARITVTPDVNATANTRRITIVGQWLNPDDEVQNTQNTLVLSVTVPEADGGDGGGGGGGGGGAAGNDLEAFLPVIGGAAAAVAALAVVFLVLLPRRRKQKARERFQKLSKEQWGKSPRSGPTPVPVPAPRSMPPAGVEVERSRGDGSIQRRSIAGEGVELSTSRAAPGGGTTTTSVRIGSVGGPSNRSYRRRR